MAIINIRGGNVSLLKLTMLLIISEKLVAIERNWANNALALFEGRRLTDGDRRNIFDPAVDADITDLARQLELLQQDGAGDSHDSEARQLEMLQQDGAGDSHDSEARQLEMLQQDGAGDSHEDEARQLEMLQQDGAGDSHETESTDRVVGLEWRKQKPEALEDSDDCIYCSDTAQELSPHCSCNISDNSNEVQPSSALNFASSETQLTQTRSNVIRIAAITNMPSQLGQLTAEPNFKINENSQCGETPDMDLSFISKITNLTNSLKCITITPEGSELDCEDCGHHTLSKRNSSQYSSISSTIPDNEATAYENVTVTPPPEGNANAFSSTAPDAVMPRTSPEAVMPRTSPEAVIPRTSPVSVMPRTFLLAPRRKRSHEIAAADENGIQIFQQGQGFTEAETPYSAEVKTPYSAEVEQCADGTVYMKEIFFEEEKDSSPSTDHEIVEMQEDPTCISIYHELSNNEQNQINCDAINVTMNNSNELDAVDDTIDRAGPPFTNILLNTVPSSRTDCRRDDQVILISNGLDFHYESDGGAQSDSCLQAGASLLRDQVKEQ